MTGPRFAATARSAWSHCPSYLWAELICTVVILRATGPIPPLRGSRSQLERFVRVSIQNYEPANASTRFEVEVTTTTAASTTAARRARHNNTRRPPSLHHSPAASATGVSLGADLSNQRLVLPPRTSARCSCVALQKVTTCPPGQVRPPHSCITG